MADNRKLLPIAIGVGLLATGAWLVADRASQPRPAPAPAAPAPSPPAAPAADATAAPAAAEVPPAPGAKEIVARVAVEAPPEPAWDDPPPFADEVWAAHPCRAAGVALAAGRGDTADLAAVQGLPEGRSVRDLARGLALCRAAQGQADACDRHPPEPPGRLCGGSLVLFRLAELAARGTSCEALAANLPRPPAGAAGPLDEARWAALVRQLCEGVKGSAEACAAAGESGLGGVRATCDALRTGDDAGCGEGETGAGCRKAVAVAAQLAAGAKPDPTPPWDLAVRAANDPAFDCAAWLDAELRDICRRGPRPDLPAAVEPPPAPAGPGEERGSPPPPKGEGEGEGEVAPTP